jgi:hypothetical protein
MRISELGEKYKCAYFRSEKRVMNTLYLGNMNISAIINDTLAELSSAEAEVPEWFYRLLCVTGLTIAIPNGIIVILAITVLRRKGVQANKKAQYCYIVSLAGSDMLVGLITFVIFMSRVRSSVVLCQVKICKLLLPPNTIFRPSSPR